MKSSTTQPGPQLTVRITMGWVFSLADDTSIRVLGPGRPTLASDSSFRMTHTWGATGDTVAVSLPPTQETRTSSLVLYAFEE